MKELSGSVKTVYLGFGCPLWPCEMNQGSQAMLLLVKHVIYILFDFMH